MIRILLFVFLLSFGGEIDVGRFWFYRMIRKLGLEEDKAFRVGFKKVFFFCFVEEGVFCSRRIFDVRFWRGEADGGLLII